MSNVVQILPGDCRKVLLTLADDTFDSCVTDPPYELGFMGKKWDNSGVAFDPNTWAQVLRVLKPGAFLLAFGGSRTYHRMACAIEDAGFEIRDQIMWLYGSGFPKSHNGEWGGTALKPAHEPIVVARKPIIGTVEQNYRAHGVGGLRIDDCRVDAVHPAATYLQPVIAGGAYNSEREKRRTAETVENLGRWPANLIHDGSEEVIAAFPQAPGQIAAESFTAPSSKTRSVYGARGRRPGGFGNVGADSGSSTPNGPMYGDRGSAARFFYCAKASQTDRNDGCEDIAPTVADEQHKRPHANNHPTVKPTELMRYLCRLVTPVGGMVLDPFIGSGSTGRGAVLEGMNLIGCELTPAYIPIANARVRAAGGIAL